SVRPDRFGQALPPWSLGLPLLTCLAFIPAALLLARPRSSSRYAGPAGTANSGPSRAGWFWSLVAFLAFGAWFTVSQYHRYALPAIALLALPAAGGLTLSFNEIAGN